MKDRLYCKDCHRFITKEDVEKTAEENVVHKNHKLVWITTADVLDDKTNDDLNKGDGENMKFEIVNPSDAVYIEGGFKACVLATLWFGNGKYALAEVDEKLEKKEKGLEMPLFLFGNCDEWFKKQFGKPLDELLKETSKEEIGKALLSVHLVGERTSLNDFVTYANRLGEKLMGGKSDA